MKKAVFLLALVALVSGPVLVAQSYDQQRVQLQFFNHYGKAYSKSNTNTSVSGSEFMNDDWMPMDIKFKDTLLRFDAVKLNLMNSNIEVLYEGEEKMIAGFFFEYVLLPEGEKKKLLVPANIFNYDGKPLIGFVEVLGTGMEKVLVQHFIYIKEPHAQAHITGGFTTNRLMKISEIFIYDGEKPSLIKKKKDLQEYYRRRGSTLDRYLKDKNFNIKDSYQLLELVERMSKKN